MERSQQGEEMGIWVDGGGAETVYGLLISVFLLLCLLNWTASSKSEGSPSQRLENVAKKPEEKKEVFRPLKPAVRTV